MTVYEYATDDRTETVHLVHQHPAAVRTLCGRSVGAAWPYGDETTSGTAATCGTCRRLVGAR